MENVRELTPQEVALFIWEDELLSDDDKAQLILDLLREIPEQELN